ncbi:S-adenosyl-L-methionine-dependent methyltransferase [Halteromyces radiatus]|uniref:S-adenosyl-L-methionine-dependent methyltransferase n=1 Tax=Halteromyces radiatus TaxID=101107 RepID=UPI00221FC47D|nr:S-adenosyl-L-methionine-dependent methyltransferase [Halteromyces radiatus]KAI8088860.1 S-adenosyl-L-methionine-dependent methyltransferase [Halteromyces radiatus]
MFAALSRSTRSKGLSSIYSSSSYFTLCIRPLTTFQPGDFCILRHIKSNRKYFIGPLEEEGIRHVKGGSIRHNQLLGIPVRSIIKTHNDSTGYMAHFPTLDEYVVNVPRACTPIYPKDACTIVQLLDVAPGHRILEAGTGNGSLTLHLARAVSGGGHIDTVDMRDTHSKTAQKHIERFERGKYQSLVTYWVGKLSDVLSKNVTTLHTTEEMYDGVVLDMPDPSEELSTILPLLRNDRFIVCYLPNMTQVLDLMQTIQDMPLFMEECLEAEWKEWDIRPTFIRNSISLDENTTTTTTMDGAKAWVCRPKNFDVKGHTAFLVKLRKCCSPSA